MLLVNGDLVTRLLRNELASIVQSQTDKGIWHFIFGKIRRPISHRIYAIESLLIANRR